jgi:hypothetical protein
VHAAVRSGELVPIESDDDLTVGPVSFPFARPEMRLFLQRFAAQYRAACGEPLVVTSLTRPQLLQPPNAHRLSVHPTGLAVDLRVSQDPACRDFLETTLLAMESEGVLDVTREWNPPHYHLALFPYEFLAFVGESFEAPPGWNADEWHAANAAAAFAGAAGASALRGESPSDAAEPRPRGGWLGRILSLPGRLISRVLSG